MLSSHRCVFDCALSQYQHGYPPCQSQMAVQTRRLGDNPVFDMWFLDDVDLWVVDLKTKLSKNNLEIPPKTEVMVSTNIL